MDCTIKHYINESRHKKTIRLPTFQLLDHVSIIVFEMLFLRFLNRQKMYKTHKYHLDPTPINYFKITQLLLLNSF
jgi:hypothetical protein